MSYYMIVKDNVKSPIFLKGAIHESFDETKYNEGMGYEWNKIFFVKQDIPKDLWLITNNKIEFDYYEGFNGHIISGDFLTLMNQVNTLQKYVISNLQVVSSNGKSKVKQPYYFIKYYNREDFVDYEKSEFTKRRVPENKILDLNYLVEKYQRIVLKENDRDVFCLNDLKLARYLFCSERFKQLCEERHMKGIRFIELEDIPQYFSSYDR